MSRHALDMMSLIILVHCQPVVRVDSFHLDLPTLYNVLPLKNLYLFSFSNSLVIRTEVLSKSEHSVGECQ